jgi:hypothetical protein
VGREVDALEAAREDEDRVAARVVRVEAPLLGPRAEQGQRLHAGGVRVQVVEAAGGAVDRGEVVVVAGEGEAVVAVEALDADEQGVAAADR